MRRIGSLCASLMGLLVYPMIAVASSPPIFPNASAFVLPASVAGGRITSFGLPQNDLPGKIKPMSRTEYDIAGTPLYYRVNVFRSDSDATASFQFQMAAVPHTGHFLSISQPSIAGERLYVVGTGEGYTVAASVYRNIELVADAELHHKPASNGMEQMTLTLETQLVGRVKDLTAHTRTLTHKTPAPTLPGRRTDANNPAVQAVLTFEPACTSTQVNSDDIATLVEQMEGQDSYIGSNDYPGIFSTEPAPHGATLVWWQFPNGHQYEFKISQNSEYISFMNSYAMLVSC